MRCFLIRLSEVAMSDKLSVIVASMYDLPAMPVVANRVLEMLQSPNYTADSLANLIIFDPVLTGRLLSMANSSFYGVHREVYALSRAIVILGEEALKGMVLSANQKNASPVPSAIQQRLWEDAVGCALGSQLVARTFRSTDADEAFLVGLLRHIGKLVMFDFDCAKYERLLEAADAGEASLDALEKDWFHFSHAVIGAAVLEKWNFNKAFVQATRHHDRLDFSADVYPAAYRLAATVNIAGNLCRVLGIGCAKPDTEMKLSQIPGALRLGISYGQMKHMLTALETVFAEHAGLFLDR